MKILRDIFSHGVSQGLSALAAFIFGAFFVALARDPVERYLIPRAMALVGGGHVMEVYFPTPKQTEFTAPDTTLSVYWPGATDELSGRVIQHMPDGKNSQSVLTGFRRDNVLSFTYRTVADGVTGIGAFFGTYKHDGGIWVGTLTGYAHEAGTDECSVEKGIAVLGDPDAQKTFLSYANAALARNLKEAQSEAPNVTDAPSGSEPVTCQKKSGSTSRSCRSGGQDMMQYAASVRFER